MRDLKYLLAYVFPLSGYLSIYLGGISSFLTIFIGFGLIPLIEEAIKGSQENLSEEEESSKLVNRFFDFLLYLNVPILYGLFFYYLSTVTAGLNWNTDLDRLNGFFLC